MNVLVVLAAIALTSGDVATSAPQSDTSSTPVAAKAPLPEVYLYGNPILGPYKVERVGATVYINQIQVFPALRDPEAKAREAELRKAEPTPAHVERHAFTQEGWEIQRKMEENGKCCRVVTTAVADFYRTRPDLVVEVSGMTDNSFWVTWTDGSKSEVLIVPSMRARSKEDDARGQLSFLQEVLQEGCIIIISSSGRVTVPANDVKRLAAVRAEIARARRTSPDVFGTRAHLYTDEQWDGVYLPAGIARELARPRKLADPNGGD